jgi:Spy/CpxP family protein refolding chaperone
MKKFLFIIAFMTTLGVMNASAQQGGGDPAAMLARMKERVKPQLIEKAKLTDVQADKVIEINFESRQQLRGLKDLSEEDRKKKMDEVKAENNKKYKAIPLTDDQVKSVDEFFEEQRKSMQKQRSNGN